MIELQSLGEEKVLNGCENSWGALDTCRTEAGDTERGLQMKREGMNVIMF